MRTLEEINKGCTNCTLPEIMLCSKCRAEHKRTLAKLYSQAKIYN